MKRLFIIIIMCVLIRPVFGQDILHNISGHEANGLLKSLKKNNPDTTRMELLLRLAEFHVFKRGEYKDDLDSAADLVGQAERLNAKIKSAEYNGFIKLVQSYVDREKGQSETGKKMAEKSMGIFKRASDKHFLGLAYFELSQYYDYNKPREVIEKERLLKLAIEEFSQSGHTELMAFSQKMLADVYNNNDESPEALNEIKLSLGSYKSIHCKELQGVYTLLGSIYYGRADLLQALNYELMALATAKSVHDTTMQLCEINNYIGLIYHQLDQNEKSILYFESALKTAEKYHDNANVIIMLYNTVDGYIILGKARNALTLIKSVPQNFLLSKNISVDYLVPTAYLNIYSALKKYNLGRPYCNQLLAVLHLPNTGEGLRSNIYTLLSKYFIAAKQYAPAAGYLAKNEIIVLRMHEPLRTLHHYKLCFKLDTSQGHFEAAVKHLLLYNKINDSVSNENKNRKLKQLTAVYETEKKEEAIKLLTARGRLQQTRLQQAEVTRNWIIALLVLVLILLGLGLDRYRVKQRINKLLEAQQVKIKSANKRLVVEKKDLLAQNDDLLSDKEWLLNEVHHRVKNNLHTVVSLLGSQAVYLKNEALKAVEKSQHRIYTMSLVHQALYREESVRTVAIESFIPELIRYLSDSYGTGGRISFELHLEALKLDMSKAVPMALIINEAVTNSIQHAFKQRTSGLIRVDLQVSQKQVILKVADNGIGMPSAGKGSNAGSLGLLLMTGLSDDIGAKMNISNDNGTTITLVFDPENTNYQS